MKQALSISLIFTLFLPTLNKLNVWIDFKINQEYIARVLCINKEEPITVCNGNCYLSEQLKKAEEDQQNQPRPFSQEKQEVTYYTDTTTAQSIKDITVQTKAGFSDDQPLNTSLHIHRVFHPPRPSVI
ncbi:MAG: hypothetical protein MI921_28900 [Cytophagales bacterium]|nr:hypothetical protein [Cytophagales bacterium]